MLQHYNKYQNNQDLNSVTEWVQYIAIYLSMPSGSDSSRYILTCRAIAIYGLPINLRYIYKRVSSLIATLIAFVWLFPTVRFQMHFQGACLNACKVTLAALVWFFSTVSFPQITTSKSLFFRSETIDVKILTHHYSLFFKHLGSAVSASTSDATAHKELLLDTRSLG